jgi:hypothetical protein
MENLGVFKNREHFLGTLKHNLKGYVTPQRLLASSEKELP